MIFIALLASRYSRFLRSETTAIAFTQSVCKLKSRESKDCSFNLIRNSRYAVLRPYILIEHIFHKVEAPQNYTVNVFFFKLSLSSSDFQQKL